MEYSIDWFQFTSFQYSPFEVIEFILEDSISLYQNNIRGINGYMLGIEGGGVRVYYRGSEGMGVHVIMTSEAIYLYEKRGKTMKTLLLKSALDHIKITRIDLAIDIFNSDEITMDLLEEHIKEKTIVTKWRAVKSIKSKETKDFRDIGHTIYFGSRKSEIMLRIYDKSKEQNMLDRKWIRFELELKGKKANEVAIELLGKKHSEVIKGILKNYIRFTDKSNDSNKSRWKNAKWWDLFLGEIDNIKFNNNAKVRELSETKDWISKQVAVSLATIVETTGGEEFLLDEIRKGKKRMKSEHKRKVKEYEEKVKIEEKYKQEKEAKS